MSDAYVGEIRYFGFDFAPQGWLPCDGRLLNINQNQALYSLLGVQFGGDGKATFGIPDMRGRVGVSEGIYTGPTGSTTYNVGLMGGSETVPLTVPTTPQHTHTLNASKTNATTPTGAGAFLAQPVLPGTTPTAENLYGSGTAVALNPAAVTANGGNSPHNNMQPYQAVTFAICIDGYYPPRN